MEDFLGRSISAGLPGYGRVFVGMSKAYGNCSFANIIVHPKSEVEGYAVMLKQDEIKKMEAAIGYPEMYTKQKV